MLRIGAIAPEGSRLMKDARGFGRDVERVSGGAIVIRWQAAGRMGDERQMAEEIAGAGRKLDGAALSEMGLGHLVPELRVWDFPALIADFVEADHLLARHRDDLTRQIEARGMVVLGCLDIGFSHIFSREPITSLADLRRHPVWLSPDDVTGQRMAKLLGLTVVSAPYTELVDGLRRGRIDTFVFPPLAAVGWGIHAHARYVTEWHYAYMIAALVLRKEVFDSLPEDQRKLLLSVGRKWEARLRQSYRTEHGKALQAIRRQGVRVAPMSAAGRREWAAAVPPAWEAMAREWKLEPMLAAFRAELEALRGKR